MKLRAELNVKNELQANPFGGVAFLGSCFSDNIGERFKRLALPAEVNPFGVIFHPLPLLDILEKINDGTKYSETDIFQSDHHFYSLAHHGNFSSTNADALLLKMNDALNLLRNQLVQCEMLCLTFGSAWGYDYEGKIVANCHKLPQKLFTKKLTSSVEIGKKMAVIFKALQSQFPQLKIILTVSPVRHVKDGLVENNRSKSQLISAVHQVSNKLEEVFYFPAYELVIDDLRDYRFYKSDLIHPSDLAVDYVYEHFKSFAFLQNEVFLELEKFSRLSAHKVLSNDEVKIQEHESLLLRQKEKLTSKYPSLNWT